MFKRSLNKAVIALVLVVVSAGLTSLGIQIPVSQGLSAPSKPKPRPRAVLKNQASTCKGQLNKAAQPKMASTRTFIKLTSGEPLPTVTLLVCLPFVPFQFASPCSPCSPPFVS